MIDDYLCHSVKLFIFKGTSSSHDLDLNFVEQNIIMILIKSKIYDLMKPSQKEGNESKFSVITKLLSERVEDFTFTTSLLNLLTGVVHSSSSLNIRTFYQQEVGLHPGSFQLWDFSSVDLTIKYFAS